MIWYRDYFERRCCQQCGQSAEPLYLHARCHLDSTVKGELIVRDAHEPRAIVQLTCCTCEAPVGTIAVEVPSLTVQHLVCSHGHQDSSQTFLYFEDDLYIMCDECQKPVGIFPVKERCSKAVEERSS